MKQFYSYLWLRDDGTPWYVGKGSGKRAYIRHGDFYPPKDKTRILILPRMSEDKAFETEIELIRNWGRKDIGTGCLYNRTDGGENPPKGRLKGRKLSEEHKKKLSIAKLGKPNLNARGKKRTESTLQKMRKPRTHSWTLSLADKQKRHETAIRREIKKKEQGVRQGQAVGYRHTDDAKNKMSAAKKGKTSWNKGLRQSAEHIAKLSAVRKGKKWSAERRKAYEEKKNAKL